MRAATFIASVIGIGFLFVLLHALGGLVSKEAVGWAPRINRGIVRWACRLLPAQHRERWLEELLADVEMYDDRPLSGTLHAMRAALGARRLARELRPAPAATGRSSTSGEEEEVAQMLGYVAGLGDVQGESASLGYASAAEFFRDRGDSARALELYELAVELSPVPTRTVAGALTGMAEIYEEQGNAEKALALLKQALAARAAVNR